MNKKMHIISKGLYRGESEKSFPVDVNEYVFIRENKNKYLLLRFTNKSDLQITSMSFWLIQKNNDGRIVAEKKVLLNDIRCAAWEPFSPEKGLLVDEKCADIEIKMISVVSGNYEYRAKNGEPYVRYLLKRNRKRFVDKEPFCSQHSKLGGKVKFTGAILFLSIVLILIATFGPLFTDFVLPAIGDGIKSFFKMIAEAMANIGTEKA